MTDLLYRNWRIELIDRLTKPFKDYGLQTAEEPPSN